MSAVVGPWRRLSQTSHERAIVDALPASRRWRRSCETSGVDCWIGIDRHGDRCLVRLAGKLGAEQVPELLLACQQPGALELDLQDLVSIDAAGVEALQRVRAVGAVLVHVPGYIQLKLDSPRT